ncbi:MAG TPA: hypothetical protein VGK74_14125 [Symbiobacteriaceae bacterium]
MSGTAVRALVAAAWRENWNRRWRFSPYKAGFWLLLVQVALTVGAVARMGGAARLTAGPGAAPGAAFLAMVLQGGVWSFMLVFLSGRGQLYGARSLPLVHIAPAPAYSVPAARVVAELPRRALSMLVWAAVLGFMLPPGERWWAVPALWATGMAAGSAGQLAGLLLLVAWVRTAPRLLGATWAVMFGLQLALFYYVVYLVASGFTLERLAESLGGLRGWLMGGLTVLFGLPGLLMLLWLARTPGRIGTAYRDGWLGLADLGDAAARPRRSRWPAVMAPAFAGRAVWGPAAGAVQAREWLYAARNPFTLFRLAVTALLLLGLIPGRPWLSRLAQVRHDLVVLAVGVGLIFFAFGEMEAALFSNEGARMGLYVMTGVRPGRLLLGKLAAMSPVVLLTALATGLAGLTVGDGPGTAARLALQGGLVGLGMAAVMAGMAALDAGLKEQEELPEMEGLAAGLEQVPRGFFSMAGLVVAGGFGAGLIWQPGPVAGAVLWVLPPLALGLGYLRLRRLLLAGV